MLSHGVRRNLPKLLAAPQSGLLLLRLGPGGSGGLPERTARLSTCHELRDLPCRTRGGYFLATLLPMRFPIASRGRWRALSPCDGWRFQTHTRFLGDRGDSERHAGHVQGLHDGREAPDHSAPKRLPQAPLMQSEPMQRLAIYQGIAPRIASLCSVLLLGGLP